MKIGAVILVAGVGIPDEEMEKFLEMKRPTIFEQMIVSYQRAGVADIALVTRDGADIAPPRGYIFGYRVRFL